MAIIEIQNRRTGAVLYSGEHADVKGAIEAAVKADASLARAYLADAYLADAYLADASLARANLARANLTCASLADANLTCANLAGANLAGAKVGAGDDEAALVGLRPIVQIGPIGSRNDWLLVFWCAASKPVRLPIKRAFSPVTSSPGSMVKASGARPICHA